MEEEDYADDIEKESLSPRPVQRNEGFSLRRISQIRSFSKDIREEEREYSTSSIYIMFIYNIYIIYI